jgi:D-tyrosyl-tRNA(Tyr) deacylase
MKSGHFSRVDPRVTRALFLSIEETRKSKHLDAFTTWMEATHWSGVVYGEQPGEYVSRIRPSVIDVEIGSCQEDWGNPLAADVMASALLELSHYDDATPVSLLCLGGVHFEPGLRNMAQASAWRCHISCLTIGSCPRDMKTLQGFHRYWRVENR